MSDYSNHIKRVRDFKGVANPLAEQRRISIGHDLSGGVAIIMDGIGEFVMPPDIAITVGTAILEHAGVHVQLNRERKLIVPS